MWVPGSLLLAVIAMIAAPLSTAASDLAGRVPFEVRAAPSSSGLGINLDRPLYWHSGSPFLNEFKRAGGWFTVCDPTAPPCRGFVDGASAQDTHEQDRLVLDENGWVKRLPAADDPSVKFRSVTALLFQGDGNARPAGRYVVRYDGLGDIEYAGAGRRIASASRPGRDVIDVDGSRSDVGLLIRIKRVVEGNHLRNIRVFAPGGVCVESPRRLVIDASACDRPQSFRSLEQWAETEIFHPSFLSDLQGFRAIRFMHWANTIVSTLSKWPDRARPGDAFWSTERGVPVEVMLQLAAVIGADPWLNVTPYVDDEYVAELARTAKQWVAAPRLVYFEYGNEPWNAALPYNVAGAWYERRAREKWPNASGNAAKLRMNWYAYRSVQLCRTVKREFGADASRVRCVANGQASNAWMSDWILECELARHELGRRCSQDFDTLSIAPYFGYYIGAAANARDVDRWLDEPDGGLTTLFRELTGLDESSRPVQAPLYREGGNSPKNGALELARSYMVESKKIADKHGLPLTAYEGGQHLVAERAGPAAGLFSAANRDARMGRVLARNIEDWKAAGGQLFVPHIYLKRSGRSGDWGLKEYQRDDAAPKWQAVREQRDRPCWWTGCGR